MVSKKALIVFLHIPKCAGTSFVLHVKKNARENAQIELEYDDLGLPIKGATQKQYLEAVRKRISRFSDKDTFLYVYGHAVPYGLDKVFGRKVKYVTFLRNPAQRVVSQYNYLVTSFRRENAKGRNKFLYKSLLVKGKVPSFKDWIRLRYKKSYKNTNKGTFEFLKDLGFTKKGKVDWDKFYFVGFTKTFSWDAAYLYGEMGFLKFFMNQNVSRKFIRMKDEDVYKLAPEKFEKDRQLFEEAWKIRSKLVSQRKFKKLSRRVRVERFFLLPFTQVLFGFDNLVLNIKNLVKDYLFPR